VVPRKNSALVFNNALDDGWDDERTEHAGTPPSSGVKYAINIWIRPSLEPGESERAEETTDASAKVAAASLSESRWRKADLRTMAYCSLGATVCLVVATWARRKPGRKPA
jgi:hypothetical protein